jgi:hypothetical protein
MNICRHFRKMKSCEWESFSQKNFYLSLVLDDSNNKNAIIEYARVE